MKTTASTARSRGIFSRRAKKEIPHTSPRSSESTGIIDTIIGSFVHAWRTVKGFVDGLTQDLRRAGLTLMWMVTLGVFAALLLVTAWLASMAVLALWLVSFGFSWIAAISLVASVSLLVAAIAILVCYRLSRDLLFPITRRRFE